MSELESDKVAVSADDDLECVYWQDVVRGVYADREDDRKRWEQARLYLEGRQKDDEDAGLVRANLIYTTMFRLISHLAAKNPEVACRPTTEDLDTLPPALTGFAHTLTRVINAQFRQARFKGKAKRWLRAAFTTEVGWLKVHWQKRYKTDPIIQDRLADTEDSLATLEALRATIDAEEVGHAVEAEVGRMRDLLAALQERAEVVVGSGIVIDKLSRDDVLVDPSVAEFEDYARARWIAQRIWMPQQSVISLADSPDFPVSKATSFRWTDLSQETQDAWKNRQDRGDAACAVWEVWDRETFTVRTYVEGVRQWLRAPYKPELLGERFYPFFGLQIYPVEGSPDPLSFVTLLRELQDEYNETRTNLADHRRISIPHYIAGKDTDVDTITRYEHAELGEIVLVDTAGKPVRDVIAPAEHPPINPAVYDTTQIRQDWELVSMLHDAAQGNVMTAKTATEASLLQDALKTGVSEMRDALEDAIAEVAEYIGELCLLELSPAEVQTMVGQDAVWPQLTLDEAWRTVRIEIRAGSTGRPNRLLEQETWQKLLPVVSQALDKVRALMMQGVDPQPEIELIKETFTRFDERLDYQRFLPQPPAVPPALAGLMGGAAMPGAMPPQGAPSLPPGA